MKPIQPQTAPARSEPGYPTLQEARTHRRGFLQQALGWTAGAGAIWILDRVITDPTAEAGTRKLKAVKGWYTVFIRVPPYPQISGSRNVVCSVTVQTRSRRLARFLLQKTEQKIARKALLPLLKGLSVQDIQNRKRLARLRKRLGTILQKQYRKRTRRRVARPEVVLSLTSRYACAPPRMPHNLPGGPRLPSHP